MKKIAVIGSGVAGVACAYICSKNGADVVLFDKSRGVSGRSTSKRWDQTTGIAIDMGVPYIYDNELSLNDYPILSQLIDSSLLVPWTLIQSKENIEQTFNTYVGNPKMSTICRTLSKNIHLKTESRIIEVDYNNHWTIKSETNEWSGFDILVSAIPAAQIELIKGVPNEIRKKAATINYHAINTCLIEMKSPLWFEDYNEDILNSPYISSIIADYKKPGRESKRFTYAIQCQPSWSTKTFDEISKDEVLNLIIKEILNHYNRSQDLILKSLCHRWKFAQLSGPADSLQTNFLTTNESPFYACGDWCKGTTFMKAFESGYSVGEAIS